YDGGCHVPPGNTHDFVKVWLHTSRAAVKVGNSNLMLRKAQIESIRTEQVALLGANRGAHTSLPGKFWPHSPIREVKTKYIPRSRRKSSITLQTVQLPIGILVVQSHEKSEGACGSTTSIALRYEFIPRRAFSETSISSTVLLKLNKIGLVSI